MTERTNESPRHDKLENRTLAAGRAFLDALGADLAALVHRLGRGFAALGRKQTHALPSRSEPRSHLAALGRAVAALVKGLAVAAILAVVTLAGVMLRTVHDLPDEKPIAMGKASLLLEAANGDVLGRAGPLKMPDAARTDFPDDLVNAVISIEDRHFYAHWGFDPEGIIRALYRNIAAGTIVQGGSTITQQLVKMRILGHERTLPHKLWEVLAAVWLEMHLGKDEILTRYLNSVYLGNGAYGMSAAARLYFDKSLSELTLPEAAMLAGMISSPSRNNPLQNLQGARARAAVVIDAMRDNGVIDGETARKAGARPATLHLSGQALRAGTWFADWVVRQAAEVSGSSSGNLRLRTTLVPKLQKLAEQAVEEILAGPGAQRHASQAALVAMRPDGAVVAMVGGRDYRASQFNRAVDAQRQPGSAFKLFVYLAALRKGLTPDDTIDAGPLDIKGWQPENFGDRHYGRMTLAEAFAESVNTAAARLAWQAGLNQVIAAARDLGITSALSAVPSMALGTAEVNLLDLTAAYASVQAGKMPIRAWGITGFGVEGQAPLQSMGPPGGATRSLQPYQEPLLELLQDVVAHGTGRAAAISGFAAGKTGTSQDYRDAWFIGFNDALTVGVWVGNDNGAPMDRVVGGSLPAAIWKRFMTDAGSVVARDERPATEPASDSGTSVAQAPAPQCDYRACARAYRSFRPLDCTYQPYDGSSRRLCDRNAPETAATPVAPNSGSQSSLERPGKAQCNIDACSRHYESFDPSDCTYKPYGGDARRVCDK